MAVEAYQIGVSLKGDVTGLLSSLEQVLKAFNNISRAQNDINIGTREIVSGLRGATRSAESLASAYDRIADACRRAATASARIKTPRAPSGGGYSDYDDYTPRPRGGGSRSSGGALVPAPSGGDVYIPTDGSSPHQSVARSGMNLDWSFLGGGSGGGGNGTGGPGSGGAVRGPFPRHGVHELGFWSGAAGAGMLRLVGAADARGFTTDTLLSVLGSDNRITPAQIRGAYNAAYDATKSAPGTRLNTNLEALIDLTNVTGNLDEARDALPAFAKMTSRLQAINRQHGGDGDEAYAAAKAMDIMGGMIDNGKINPTLMQDRLDKMTRVAVATNDKVDPKQYLAFAKQARSAGMLLSDEFVYERLPAMMQTIGGSRTGTALMSLSQVYQGDRLTNKSYDALAAIGLAPKRSGPKGKQGKLYDVDLMGVDPLSYVQKAEARMDAYGIHGTDAQLRALSNAQQRSTMAGLLADLVKDMPAILRDQERIRHTDISGMDKNAAAAVNSLSAAWDKMLTVAGNSNTKDAIAAINAVTNGFNALGDAEKKHPNVARVLTDVAVGIGAIAVASGAALLAIGPILALKGLKNFAFPSSAAEVGAGAAAVKPGGSTLSKAGSRLLVGYLAHEALGWLDPTDKAGGWIDRNVPGASWLDNQASRIGLGHSYAEQGKAEITITPAPIMLDGRVIGQAVFDAQARQTQQQLRSTSSHADGIASPQLPGAAWAH